MPKCLQMRLLPPLEPKLYTLGQVRVQSPFRLRQMAKGEGESSIAPFAGDTFAFRLAH